MSNSLEYYRSPLALGLCITVDPTSLEATKLLDAIEPMITWCDMPDCKEKAVSVGIFGTPARNSERRFDSDFRGLCERHREPLTTTWGVEYNEAKR